MTYLDKIKEMLLRGCNITEKINFSVNNYKKILLTWNYYKNKRKLPIHLRSCKNINDLFNFHYTDKNHIILYHSSSLYDALCLSCIEGRYVNFIIPADQLIEKNYSFYAVYT